MYFLLNGASYYHSAEKKRRVKGTIFSEVCACLTAEPSLLTKKSLFLEEISRCTLKQYGNSQATGLVFHDTIAASGHCFRSPPLLKDRADPF